MTPSVPAVVVHAGRLLLLGGTTQGRGDAGGGWRRYR